MLKPEIPLKGFELFVQSFANGETEAVPETTLREPFGPYLQILEKDCWKVFYDEQNWCEISVFGLPSEPNLIRLLAIAWPCADVRLWDALSALLKAGRFALYFTAPHFETQKNFMLVADESVLPHLPKKWVQRHGVRRVHSGQDICRELQTA